MQTSGSLGVKEPTFKNPSRIRYPGNPVSYQLNLQAPAGGSQGEQRPDPVVEGIELLETRAAQIRRFQPEAFRGQAAAFR